MTRPTKRQVQTALAFFAGQPIEPKPERCRNDRPEAAALIEVIRTLRGHPAIAWIERQNSGAFTDSRGQFVRFGWPGCSDVIGQLRDGRFLAVEVKAERGRLSEAQRIFLDRVAAAGGVAFVARNAVDVFAGLSAVAAA
jgi:hypothetical protein